MFTLLFFHFQKYISSVMIITADCCMRKLILENWCKLGGVTFSFSFAFLSSQPRWTPCCSLDDWGTSWLLPANLNLSCRPSNVSPVSPAGLGRRGLLQRRRLLPEEGPGGGAVLQLQAPRLWPLHVIPAWRQTCTMVVFFYAVGSVNHRGLSYMYIVFK